MFLWNNHFFTVTRNQMFLDVSDGGLGLVDVDLKSKALFIKNILFSYPDADDPMDRFMMAQCQNTSLTKATREWLSEVSRIALYQDLITTKSIYRFLQSEKIFVPKVVQENPDLDWKLIWENISSNFLTSNSREALFLVMNDVICTKSKQFRNNVRGVENNICDFCNSIDTTEHRIKYCTGSVIIWIWLKNVLNVKLKIMIDDPEEILATDIDSKDSRLKAALFLIGEVISFNLKHYGTPTQKKNVNLPDTEIMFKT